MKGIVFGHRNDSAFIHDLGLDGAFAQCGGDIAAWGQMEPAEL